MVPINNLSGSYLYRPALYSLSSLIIHFTSLGWIYGFYFIL